MRPFKLQILLVLVLAPLAFFVGRACAPVPDAGPAGTTPGPAAAEPAEPDVWTCSMHPQVRMPEPGRCPICAMDLVPLQSGAGSERGPRELALSENAVALADIVTSPVERRIVERSMRLVGKVAYDETRVATLTAWVPGRLQRLFVDYTGVSVRAGDHMVELYSPALFATQEELLQAVTAAQRPGRTPNQLLGGSGGATAESVRKKLRLLGMSDAQIAEIEQRGTPEPVVTVNAPIGGVVVHKNAIEGLYVKEGDPLYTIADLSQVWVMLDAYESDLTWLRYGEEVEFESEAYPGEVFHGRIAFIDPLLDDRTRTVKVRVHTANEDLRLKPEMFVRARVRARLTAGGRVLDPDLAGRWMCPMHPEVVSESAGACRVCGMDLVPVEELGFRTTSAEEGSLVIPATAPLLTGKRAVVYVRLPAGEGALFEGREVVLGPRAGDVYIVREGLSEGDLVVTRGAFKLDSELQIQARPSMMSPQGGRAPGHHHGGAEAPAGQAETPQEQPAAVEAPAAFRAQLGDLAEAYLALQAALAADDTDAASAAASDLLLRQKAIDMSLLGETVHDAWMPLAARLRAAASEMVRAEDVEAQRQALEPLTAAVSRALETFGYELEGQPLQVFHCPMAFEGRGADWLQAADETANPYFGASMLRCGDAVRTLEREP